MEQNRLTIPAGAREAAAEWEAGGRSSLTHPMYCYREAVMGYFSAAVNVYSDAESGIAFLKQEEVGDLLKRLLFWQVRIREMIECGQIDERGGYATMGAGDYAVAQFCWILEINETADAFLELAAKTQEVLPTDEFQREYLRAMISLSKMEPYEPRVPEKLGRHRQRLMAYLRLISAATQSRPLEPVLQEIDRSFDQRNRDKRIGPIAWDLGPSGNCPIGWDTQRESILTRIGRREEFHRRTGEGVTQ